MYHLNKIKTILILTVTGLFFLPQVIFSQNQANNWYFGNRAGITFNTTPPSALQGSVMNAWEGVASISDSDGDFLFYTDGITVWDRNHNQMPNGNGLNGDPSSAQSGIILPNPGNPNLYYIFSVPREGGNFINPARLYYSVVDITLNGGMGDVVNGQKNINISPDHRIQEKVTAILHCNGEDLWVLAHEYNSNRFLIYLIEGENPPELINTQEIGINWDSGNFQAIGILKASSDGSKIADTGNTNDKAQVLDFNNETGELSNPVELDNIGYAYGAEFSPSNDIVYFTTWYHFNPRRIVYQYDLTAPNINATRVELSTQANVGSMQLGPDGIIYVARNTDDGGGANNGRKYLGAITNPDNYDGTPNAFGWVEEAIDLGGDESNPSNGGLSRYGLPNFIQSYFVEQADFSYVDTCLYDATSFNASIPYTYESVLWVFDEYGESTELNPSFTFPSEGTFDVELHIIGNCNTEVITKTITILPSLIEDFEGDITVCQGEDANYSIAPVQGHTINWNITGGTVIGGAGTNEATINWTELGEQTISINLSPEADCSQALFTVTVTACDEDCTPPTVTTQNLSECGTGSVDLNDGITDEETATTNSFYSSETDAQNATNPINANVETSGTYYIRVERDDDNECYSIASIEVTIEEEVTPTFPTIPSICQNETPPSLPTTSNNDIEGTWSSAITTDELGTYTITFTPQPNECASSAEISITIIDCSECTPPTVTTQNLSECGTGSVDLNDGITDVETATTYDFYPTEADAQNATNPILANVEESGTYYIRIERDDDSECYSIASIEVTIEEEVTPTFSTIPPICQNETPPSLPTTSDNGIEGTWSSVITTDEIDTYTITFTPQPNECATTAEISITIIDCSECTPPAFATTDLDVCANDEANLESGVSNIPNGTSISFHTSQSDAQDGTNPIMSVQDTTGTFYVRVYYDNDPDCFSFGTLSLTIIEPIEAELVLPDSYCNNDPVDTLIAIPNDGIWIGDGIIDSISGIFDPSLVLEETEITFIPNGACVNTSQKTVTVFPAPSPVIYGGDITVLEGTEVTLSTDEYNSYLWSPEDYLDCIDCQSPLVTPFEDETYQVIVTNEYGCMDSTTTDIFVIKECHGAFIPDNFSPNNDGKNDQLCVFSNCIVTMRLQIFNRWGERIFISENEDECWDGTHRGEPAGTGVYVYRFEAELSNGENVKLQGNINLFR